MVQQIVLPIKDSNILQMVQDTLLDSFRAGRIPPHFSKFQIFFKNFPALPLGKIASNFKTMREFHSLKLPWASSDRNKGGYAYYFIQLSAFII
ncbi:hypothetical protein LMT8_09620 [Leuconostoc mesenteroides subsp. cremoris TIFN8]|nr:hypothetical protein LMT8_00555 [Leuconostoc mesenteroides subsp. cremoris TIFN8]EQC53176.1 hypothetical protein LMT8_09620 [Leuconostoc mesenteroides subsp. cremoris TIFN8]